MSGEDAKSRRDAAGFRGAALAGLSASLVGIGLARFAYTPLLPVLIDQGWFAAGEAAYLGAANLAGYLAGALLAQPMARRAGAVAVLRLMMLLATAAFFACAVPLSFAWFFVWRFASGYAGGALMALAAPTVLPHVPPQRRGLVSGAVFTGVGLGIAASGTLVPLLLEHGLATTWIGLGLFALALTAAAWFGWPAAAPATADAPARRGSSRALRILYLQYALNAVGLVPHMVFLVDFIARGLGRGLEAGAIQWVLFGAGAVAGPLLAGRLADRVGFAATLRIALVLQAAAAVLPAVTGWGPAIGLSSLIVGAFVPGIVPVVLGRSQQLAAAAGTDAKAAWSLSTTAFALGQAVAAYGFSYLFALTGSYPLLFACGAGALVLALLAGMAPTRNAEA